MQVGQMLADRLAHASLHAITHHRAAQRLAHRQSNARRAAITWTKQKENREVWGKMPHAAFVNCLEIGMLQQARRFRKVLAGRMVSTGDHNWNLSSLPVRAIHGTLALPRPACAPWRGGATTPSVHRASSCGCENRAS